MSESGRLRHGERGQGPGDRRGRALKSTILSLFLDLAILLHTIPVVVFGRGLPLRAEVQRPTSRCA